MNETLYQKAELIAGYLKGSLSSDGERELSEWINESPDNRHLFDQLTNPETLRLAITRHDDRKTKAINDLNAARWFKDENQDKWWYRRRDRIGLLGTLLVFVLTITFLWLNETRTKNLTAMLGNMQEDIEPGSDQARLYLEDSLVVIMVDTVDGIIAQQSDNDVQVLKENGWLFYHSSHPGDTISYNALEVPRKGKFRVILPDGSRAWLNADSRLKYPALFGNNFRRVNFSGEGYFEVTGLPATLINPINYTDRLALGKARPFLIDISGRQLPATIQVSGSRFNVRAYRDEDYIEVLSLEGEVQVRKGDHHLTLLRNQTGRIYDDGRSVVLNNVMASTIIAWKDNFFKFDKTPLPDVMKAVERWYDVQMDYGDHTSRQAITGVYDRDVPLSKLLRNLATTTGIRFQLKGKVVSIIP
ncbi:FecR family protein [Paraflavitalea pollutisoli]|uniref:FecR family protein n=1 Tax=Paraflavitalea pollutisoli TaxID=3034143 RepID=UPI0023EDF291|nr:FecR domain-containing protein [Paraflavitalea sp. H1-2-19X]